MFRVIVNQMTRPSLKSALKESLFVCERLCGQRKIADRQCDVSNREQRIVCRSLHEACRSVFFNTIAKPGRRHT